MSASENIGARWSTGRGEPRVIRVDGVPVAVAFTVADAALIVRAMNERARTTGPPPPPVL